MLATIRDTGGLPEGDAFDEAVAEFAANFEGSPERD
jgi:hypothetical protein